MPHNLLPVELASSLFSSELGMLSSAANLFVSTANLSQVSLGQEQTSLHSPAIAPFMQPEQASLLLPTLWLSPEQDLQPAQPGGDADSLLGHNNDLSQPLVGILDTGFDLSSSEQAIDLVGLGDGQIYLGYDWVEGDRNPLITSAVSTPHGSQVLEAFSQAVASNTTAPHNTTPKIWLGRAVGSGDWAASLVEFVATAGALGHRNAVANLSFDLTEVQADGSIIPRTALSNHEIAALEFARQQGVIVVAAAGNDNTALSALAQASQAFDNILTVGAAEQTGGATHRASYSNYGAGVSLLAVVPETISGLPQGTSLAAAQVTQAVQNLWQHNADLSHQQVIDLLQNSATDLQAPGWDRETGHGLLNPLQALQDASQLEEKIDASPDQIHGASSSPPSLNPWNFTSNNPRSLERPLALDVAQVTPGNGTTNIDTQASIRVQFASEAIDPATLTSDSFQLLDSNGNPVTATIGSDLTGGVISLTPVGPLDPFSSYSIVITAALLNTQGQAATPFSTSFTTGVQGSGSAGLGFTDQAIVNGESRFGVTSIAVGPDGNVYASDILGNILRYNLDPSTGLATSTENVFAQNDAQIVGIAFDPNASATDLQLWISYANQSDSTGFSGTISKLDLPVVLGGATTKQDYITGLPNSINLSHQPNGITFGPDGKLYQTVGGVSTLGGTANWGVNESLLSAAVIVADVNSASFPTAQTGNAVNVQTVGLDNDNNPTTENYDPFATNAPVEIFATGLRNGYDLAWHSNGQLYSGINQNSIGGNVLTPANGSIPAINARPNEMLALIQAGRYYGHPNPSRGEYVLNGGNPTAGVDVQEVPEYPVGVQPDPDFDASLIYDTRSIGGTSPNGLTEYTGSGLLNGRLLVSFFSGARTIQSFELGSNGLVTATDALQDSNGNNLQFNSPLDVAVHPSGRVYVADFGFAQSNPNGGNVRVLTPLATPSVIITPSSGSTDVTEGGGSDNYSVALATQPVGAVTVGINPDGQLNSDVTSLTFTTTDWNVPQSVTISAVDDSDLEGQHSGSISHSITSGSGDYGTGLAIASLSATITDNDNLPPVAGVEIIETNGGTTVTEGGNSDSLSIRLTAEPEANVILTVIPDGQLDLGVADSGTVDLTFTPTNWNTAQSITVDAVDDSLVEGLHSGELNYHIDSADETYEELAIAPTSISITDNDAPPPAAGLILQPSGPGTTVAESGSTDSYQVSLASQPSAEVTITLAADSQLNLGNGQAPSLVFTPGNWDTPQTVSLGAVDDSLIEGNHSGSITHSISSSDSSYAVLSDETLTATILDNDQASVVITPSGNSTDVTEGGGSDGYSLALSSQPTANVVLTIGFANSQDSSQVSLSRQTLSFTPSNWDSPQVVQITAVDDNIREGSQVLSLTHTANSSDGNYDGLAIAPLTVNLFDNENGGTALFVAGSTSLSGSDIQARAILEDLGFDITVVDDGASTTADASGKDLVVISQSVSSNLVGSKFTDVDVPIVVWESFLYDDLGLANNFGLVPGGANSLTFTNNTHPLAADLALGNQTIYSNTGELGWGSPTSSEVISIAHTGNPSQLGIFGYEADAAMDVGIAPARRVAVNLWETPNANGSELFKAAVQWATAQETAASNNAPEILSNTQLEKDQYLLGETLQLKRASLDFPSTSFVIDQDGANDVTLIDFKLINTDTNTIYDVADVTPIEIIEYGRWGNFSYDLTLEDLPTGNYEITAIAFDRAGAQSDIWNDTFNLLSPNRAPEILANTQLEKDQYVLGETLQLKRLSANFPGTSFVIDQEGANDVTLIDFKLINVDTNTIYDVADITPEDITEYGRWGNFSYNLALTDLPTGNYEITAIAFDQAGAQSDVWNDTFNLLSPNRAPEILSNTQLERNQYFLGETLRLKRLASGFPGTSFVVDQDGANDVTLIDFKLIHTDTNTIFDLADITPEDITEYGRWGNFSYDLILADLPPGSYDITATAFDQAGAQSTMWVDQFDLDA